MCRKGQASFAMVLPTAITTVAPATCPCGSAASLIHAHSIIRGQFYEAREETWMLDQLSDEQITGHRIDAPELRALF